MKEYRVRVRVNADLIYIVEAESVSEAKEEAAAFAAAGDMPEDIECIDVGKASIEKPE